MHKAYEVGQKNVNMVVYLLRPKSPKKLQTPPNISLWLSCTSHVSPLNFFLSSSISFTISRSLILLE